LSRCRANLLASLSDRKYGTITQPTLGSYDIFIIANASQHRTNHTGHRLFRCCIPARQNSHGSHGQRLFQASFFWGGGNLPLPKLTLPPPNGCQIVCSKSFFSVGAMNCTEICHGNILLMDNKHRKLFVVKQSEGCRFMPKIHLNTFGGRALPLGEHTRSPLRSPSRKGEAYF